MPDAVFGKETEQHTKNINAKFINLSLDGWSNIYNEPICICVTAEDGIVYFIETTNTLGNTQTTEHLNVVAVHSIQTKHIFKCQVNNFVRVNAANVANMGRNLEDNEGNLETYKIWLQCSFDATFRQLF